jgi:hypothetical protein
VARKILQLNAGCPPGQNQPPWAVNPDGTMSSAPYSIPSGQRFYLTDISFLIATSMPTTPSLIAVGLKQSVGSGTAQRWNFVGYLSRNFERNFSIPIVFSTDFQVSNECGTYLNFNIYGYEE